MIRSSDPVPLLDAFQDLEDFCLATHAAMLAQKRLGPADTRPDGTILVRNIRTAALSQFEIYVEYPSFSLRAIRTAYATSTALEHMAALVGQRIANIAALHPDSSYADPERLSACSTLEAMIANVRHLRHLFNLQSPPSYACRPQQPPSPWLV